MPKVIENLKDTILREAKKQVMEKGFSEMTIRSVAKECGIGVGTIYNYFDSKTKLTASFMLSDWIMVIQEMEHKIRECTEPKEKVRTIWDGIIRFRKTYDILKGDSEAEKSYSQSMSSRHPQIISQIGCMLMDVCEESGYENPQFLSEYIRENILLWSSKDCDFERFYSITGKLLEKKN